MTLIRSLTGLGLLLAASVALLPSAAAADAPPPPPPPQTPQTVPVEPPPPTAVFVRPLDDQGHAAVVPEPPPPSIGPSIDSVLKIMRQLGMITASATVMLFGSAVTGVLIAGLVLLVRRRRERRAAV